MPIVWHAAAHIAMHISAGEILGFVLFLLFSAEQIGDDADDEENGDGRNAHCDAEGVIQSEAPGHHAAAYGSGEIKRSRRAAAMFSADHQQAQHKEPEGCQDEKNEFKFHIGTVFPDVFQCLNMDPNPTVDPCNFADFRWKRQLPTVSVLCLCARDQTHRH